MSAPRRRTHSDACCCSEVRPIALLRRGAHASLRDVRASVDMTVAARVRGTKALPNAPAPCVGTARRSVCARRRIEARVPRCGFERARGVQDVECAAFRQSRVEDWVRRKAARCVALTRASAAGPAGEPRIVRARHVPTTRDDTSAHHRAGHSNEHAHKPQATPLLEKRPN